MPNTAAALLHHFSLSHCSLLLGGNALLVRVVMPPRLSAFSFLLHMPYEMKHHMAWHEKGQRHMPRLLLPCCTAACGGREQVEVERATCWVDGKTSAFFCSISGTSLSLTCNITYICTCHVSCLHVTFKHIYDGDDCIFSLSPAPHPLARMGGRWRRDGGRQENCRLPLTFLCSLVSLFH